MVKRDEVVEKRFSMMQRHVPIQLKTRDQEIGRTLYELLLQYHHTYMDEEARKKLTQRIMESIDDMVYNYLVAGMRSPVLLKKLSVGVGNDEELFQMAPNVCRSGTLEHIRPHVVCRGGLRGRARNQPLMSTQHYYRMPFSSPVARWRRLWVCVRRL